MANKHKNINVEMLWDLADEYVNLCIDSTKEIPTGKGVQDIKERHLPTVNYFLLIWLKRKHFDFYKRTNWYDAKKDEAHPLSNTIKNIDEYFNALAVDIVANEGKGIFYAKNKLGMTDTLKTENKHEVNEIIIKREG